MRLRAQCLAAALMAATGAMWGTEIALSLETADGNGTITAASGTTLSLQMILELTDVPSVSGLFYTVEMPGAGWVLEARDYASYGWCHNDGTFDRSTPIPSLTTFPVTVTNSLYGFTPITSDFVFETSRVPSGDPPSTDWGGGIVEAFSLTVPELPAGTYALNIGLFDAFGAGGILLTGETTTSLLVIVPEPSVAVLSLLAMIVLLSRRGRSAYPGLNSSSASLSPSSDTI